MRRFALGASLTGLGLMTTAALFLCGSPLLGLETRTILFVFGVLLFILGGSGHRDAGRRPERAPASSVDYTSR